MQPRHITSFSFACVVVVLTGCGSMYNVPQITTTPAPATPSVISQLATTTVIGSTTDVATSGPGAGDTNPYGLAIVPGTVLNTSVIAGTTTTLSPGDLIVCNFNSATTAGAGTTIEDIKPAAGSKPVRIFQGADMTGCNSLALNPTKGAIWAAAYTGGPTTTAGDNPIIGPTGTEFTSLSTAFAWNHPWGQIYGSPTPAAGATTTPPAAFYISQAGSGTGTGSIVQALVSASPATYTEIISGFPQSVSASYGILAPAGLTYDPSSDTLYVVSSDTDSVLAFSGVSTYVANSVVITFTPGTSTGGAYPTSTTASFAFSGPNAANAKVIFSGAPLNYPISSALLYNGDLIVGNTGDNNMVEISPSTAAVVGSPVSVEKGPAGAIFGIATTGTSLSTQKIYFNDDDTGNVVSISQ